VCIAGKKFGVTDFINPADCEKPLPEVIKEMTDGGVDYAFECTGCEGMISIAFESCQNGWGTTVVTSVLRENASIRPSDLLNGRTLKGTMYGGFKTRSDLPELVERYLRKVQTADSSSLPSSLHHHSCLHLALQQYSPSEFNPQTHEL
jgi:Zn-dependent alcohol dehydrogenase